MESAISTLKKIVFIELLSDCENLEHLLTNHTITRVCDIVELGIIHYGGRCAWTFSLLTHKDSRITVLGKLVFLEAHISLTLQ